MGVLAGVFIEVQGGTGAQAGSYGADINPGAHLTLEKQLLGRRTGDALIAYLEELRDDGTYLDGDFLIVVTRDARAGGSDGTSFLVLEDGYGWGIVPR